MNDPNFPSNLDIKPLQLRQAGEKDEWKQKDAIRQYGIAGRVWEASHALMEYFDPDSTVYTPRCSIFHRQCPFGSGEASASRSSKSRTRTIIELGSGQSVASLQLAKRLDKADTLVLTDLPNVVPLMQQSIDTWSGQPDVKGCAVQGDGGTRPVAEPLAWGGDIGHLRKYGQVSHIICCDLVYFPHLYPPLLRTLLQLTEPGETLTADHGDVTDEVFGPEVILAYKSRTLALEQSFFDSLALYFRLEPVVSQRSTNDDSAKIYICRRWRVTVDWVVPAEKDVMNGSKEVVRGSSGYGLVEEMLGAIEWD